MHKLAAAIASGLLLCASTALAEDQPVVSARVMSYEGVESLVRTICDLSAVAELGGRARLFDVAIAGTRCSSLTPAGDAVPLRVRFEPIANGWRSVVFEADVPEGVSSNEMLAAVDGAARELVGKLGVARPRAVAPAVADDSQAPPKHESTRGGGIALIAVGAGGLGVAALIGLVALVDAAGQTFGCAVSSIGGGSCGSRDMTGYGIAAGIAGGVGLVLLVTGAIVLSNAPNKPAVAALIGPTGGGLRVTF